MGIHGKSSKEGQKGFHLEEDVEQQKGMYATIADNTTSKDTQSKERSGTQIKRRCDFVLDHIFLAAWMAKPFAGLGSQS